MTHREHLLEGDLFTTQAIIRDVIADIEKLQGWYTEMSGGISIFLDAMHRRAREILAVSVNRFGLINPEDAQYFAKEGERWVVIDLKTPGVVN